GAYGGIERRMAVSVHVAPQRRHAVQVAPALRVDEPAALRLGDDERLLPQPVGHLREGVPEVAMVPVDEARIAHAVPPTACAAAPNAARTRSIWASVWVAIGVTRRRAVPGGTVGGRMAWASTPPSSNADANAMARALSPMRTGTMWVSPPARSPRAARPGRRRSAWRSSTARRSGSASSTRRAAPAAATAAGASPVV